MYIIYNTALIILAIFLSPVILAAFLIQPKFRAGFWQKIGFYDSVILSRQGKRKSILFHAVSVGEVNAVESLIKRVKQEFPEHDITITTVTKTGQDVANKKLKDTADIITYFPYDFSFSVNATLNALNPDLIVIAETEIWPAFCHHANKKNIPLMLVNGRISPNSHKGYRKAKIFFKRVLNNFSLILMQTDKDLERIIDIGAPQEKTEVMGNLKFDITDKLNDSEINELKQSLKIGENKVLIAGSTHKGEDEIILNTYKRLKKEFSALKLIIAPRHPERNDRVFKLISSGELKSGKKSNGNTFEDCDIILLDTMGELGKLYSVADIAFLGGSFSGTGGHNPLEAAIYGVPVVSGPDIFNFRDIFKFMKDSGAAVIVNTENELYEKIMDLSKNDGAYTKASAACFEIFNKNKGALDFAVQKIKTLLS